MPSYDSDTRLVHRIDYDGNRDGRIDARLYYHDGHEVRLEADTDGDRLVDRWERYDPQSGLTRVGTSSARDGIVDTWSVQDANRLRLEISTRRDGVTDRWEQFENGVLLRTEADTNGDGRIDQWQRFENGAIRQIELDTTFATGRPDRRLVYASNGAIERVETPEP